jgi:hypothetical protein
MEKMIIHILQLLPAAESIVLPRVGIFGECYVFQRFPCEPFFSFLLNTQRQSQRNGGLAHWLTSSDGSCPLNTVAKWLYDLDYLALTLRKTLEKVPLLLVQTSVRSTNSPRTVLPRTAWFEKKSCGLKDVTTGFPPLLLSIAKNGTMKIGDESTMWRFRENGGCRVLSK